MTPFSNQNKVDGYLKKSTHIYQERTNNQKCMSWSNHISSIGIPKPVLNVKVRPANYILEHSFQTMFAQPFPSKVPENIKLTVLVKQKKILRKAECYIDNLTIQAKLNF